MAVLSVIGGLDDRPRIGGLVQHDELGMGTITKIKNKNNVVVLFYGGRSAKLCSLSSLETVKLVYIIYIIISVVIVCGPMV